MSCLVLMSRPREMNGERPPGQGNYSVLYIQIERLCEHCFLRFLGRFFLPILSQFHAQCQAESYFVLDLAVKPDVILMDLMITAFCSTRSVAPATLLSSNGDKIMNLMEACCAASNSAKNMYNKPGWFSAWGVGVLLGKEVSCRDLESLVQSGFLLEGSREEARAISTSARIFRPV